MDGFWEKFRREYLTSLLTRSKWQTSSTNFEVGDVVIIVEDITPRESWRVARITEIVNSDVTRTRRFKLRDASGNVFDRHATGVVKIELS